MTDTQDPFKQAFAPFAEGFKSFQTLEVPEAARQFVKRATETAKEKTADLHAGAERLTVALETAAADSLSEATKISRSIQQAISEDTEKFFAGLDKLVSAKSFNEAVQAQSDYLRSHGETLAARAKTASEYVANLVSQQTKTVQDNLAKVYTKSA